MASNHTPQKPVLISGAGLASLLLAQSLRRSQIPFRIFERDESFIFRAQGYRLRLSTEGLDAIESVLTPDHFARFWAACGKTKGSQPVQVDAQSGESKEQAQLPSGSLESKLGSRDGQTVGVARGDMRRIFAEGCEEHIEWGRHVTGYELTEDGVRAIFADGGKSVEGSLLVGGEGIYSRVARQVSGGKLKVYDTGARGIHGQAPTTAFKELGEGVFMVRDTSRGDGNAVFMITNVRSGDMDDPDKVFGWTMGGAPGVIKVDDTTLVGKPAADLAKSLTQKWHPRLRSLIDNMHVEEAAFWKITCSSPSGVPVWPNEPRVTVIGDAVHSMTPAGGIGANTAVRDSALLGKLLAEGWRQGVTAEYEETMRVYGSEAVAASYSAGTRSFGINIVEGTTPTVN